MKVHYVNILLFALPLNILAHNNSKTFVAPRHSPTTRLLCECDIYTSIYDNDTEMKKVMDNFDRQTSERFKEYDERMQNKQRICKDQCDKEIQNIILKDKIEKQMAEHFSALETKIDPNDIPTCICEKSLADKVEKRCLKCAQNLGGIVVPSSGVLGGIGEFGLSVWKPAALAAAKEFAEKAGAAQGAVAGKAAGMRVVIGVLEQKGIAQYCPNIFKSIQKIENFTELKDFVGAIINKHGEICAITTSDENSMCLQFDIILGIKNAKGKQIGPPAKQFITRMLEDVTKKADQAAAHVTKTTSESVTADLTAEKTNLINTIYGSWETTIIASVIAIVVIVLIMVIIYLILRYRRKKKMKKKLQYIKLLEE